ncbi:MAG TPA: hypothetical protein VFP72_09740 [Kineosporiaceae bacterium]|nr:hypothetical protein [Kineosporiaceae bacterium]
MPTLQPPDADRSTAPGPTARSHPARPAVPTGSAVPAGSAVPVSGRHRARRLLPVLACGALLLTGCSALTGGTPGGGTSAGGSSGAASSGGSSASPAAAIPAGPGPQPRYTVQPQPAAGTCHYRHQGIYPLPDPNCTPGATNPKVTQDTLATTICRPGGYTSSIRPPADITGREKAANARSYGYTGSFTTGEYDHLISLQLGGDPNDPRNLWVEPNDDRTATSTNNSKDSVEDKAHDAICSGRMNLAEVQQAIATDWVALGRRLGLKLP